MAMFITMFATLFGSNPSSHKERLYQKMMRNNQEAYEKYRSNLQKFADRFRLPVCDREKQTGLLVKNKRVRKYEAFIKRRKEKLLLKRGCSWYTFMDQSVIALNKENAIRKINNRLQKISM